MLQYNEDDYYREDVIQMSDYKSFGFASEAYYQFPNIVNLEVYRGKCPCKCIHCPVGRVEYENREERFGTHAISLSLFSKVIKEMEKYQHSTIRIHSVGEPLLWPELVPALRILHETKVRSWIFTSLITNDKSVLNALCECCDIVEVSVNSCSRSDYLQTKGIDSYDVVVDNLHYMIEYISSHNLKTRIVLSRVQSDSKEMDDAFVSYWKATGLCADAFVRKYHNYNNLLEERSEIHSSKVPCLVHWMRFNIAYDGTVVTCFNELFHPVLREDVVLGNLNDSTIHEIWHSDSMMNLRYAELHGYGGSSYDEDFPCRNCFSCQAYDGKHETSEHQIEALT